MPFRLVSTGEVSFDVNPETYTRMLLAIKSDIASQVEEYLQYTTRTRLHDSIAEQLIGNFDNSEFYSNIIAQLSSNLNYNYIVDSIKQQVVGLLLGDDRFNTLLSRCINNATVGVVDETVERVTARLQNQINGEGDA